jgi:hypothetical protein
MQQDSLLISLGGDGASVLLPLAYFAFRIKKQIKRKPMSGILAPEGSKHAHTIVASQPVIRHGDQ